MQKKIVATLLVGAVLSSGAIVANASSFYEPQETYLEENILSACEICGQKYGVCPELLMALVETESSGKQDAINGTCYGVCQINSTVWGGDYDTVYKQVDKACQILLQYADSHCGDINCALMKYNGEPNAEKLCDLGKQTTYSKTVLERAEELERLHDK